MNVDAAARAAAKAIDRSATRLDPVTGLDDLLRRHRRQPLRRVAAAAAVALLVAAAAIWTGLALRRTPVPTLAPITRFRASPSPASVAVTPGAVWVLDVNDSNTMSRVDPSTARVAPTASPRLPERRDGRLLFAISAEGRLWVVSAIYAPKDDTAISAIDPATGQTVTTFEVGGVVSLEAVSPDNAQVIYGDVAVGSGAVWVSLQRQNEVRRFDSATGRLVDGIKLPKPTALAVDDGTVWVGSADGRLRSIDVASGRVKVRATTTTMVTRIQVGQGGVWLMTIDGNVLRVNRRTGRVTQVPSDFTATDLAAGPEGIWVYDPQRGAVLRIDPGTNRVARTIPVAAYPLRAGGAENTLGHILAVGNGAVWVLDKPTDTMVRVDPYR
jgi:outer membrane protein assembly factor BamB